MNSDRGRGSLGHAAAAFENNALVHAQARGSDLALERRGAMNLHPVLGPDVAVHLAAHHDDAGVDFALNPGALADDQRVGRENLSTEHSVDADSPVKTKFSFEFTPLINNP